MKLIPKYQRGDLVIRQDNTRVARPPTFKPVKQRVTLKPQPQFIQDNRSKWQHEQDSKKTDIAYKQYIDDKNTQRAMQTLDAFLEFTDYAGLATGITSLASKGVKYIGKRAVRNIMKPKLVSEVSWDNWSKGGDISKAHLSEYADIERNSKRLGTWLKNPDGSLYTGDPRSWIQMQSKDFKEWFKDGTLVEPNGSPMVFYHGSPSNTITEFRKPSHPDYIKGKGRGTGEEGIYVTPNKSYAERYKSPDLMRGGDTSNSALYELWSNANPIEFNSKNFPTSEVTMFYKTSKADRALVEKGGNNAMSLGKILNNMTGKRPELNVFEPTQLKSVIGNNGDFSKINSNIFKVGIPTTIGLKANKNDI